MIVVDACVAVKWFIPEPMSPEADALLQTADERVAPEHILVEVGNTLLRAFRSGSMTLEHMQQSIESLARLVQLIPTRDLASQALRIAVEASCTNYDALYVAASERLDATLITADKRLVAQLQSTRWSGRVRLLGLSSDL